MGVAQLLDVTAAESVARGELEVVLAGFSDVGPPVSAMFAKERGTLPVVRAFSDFLADLTTTNIPGDGVLVREHYMSARD